MGCAALLLASFPVMGQKVKPAEQIAALIKAQPAASQAVLARLERLGRLPAGEWRLHAGDLAHGEAVNLDDSGWEMIKPRSKAPNDAVWFLARPSKCPRR